MGHFGKKTGHMLSPYVDSFYSKMWFYKVLTQEAVYIFCTNFNMMDFYFTLHLGPTFSSSVT